MKGNRLPITYTRLYRGLSFLRKLKRGRKRFIHDKSSIESDDTIEYFLSEIESIENKLIEDIFKSLEKYSEYIQVFLHGSYADNTTTDFSDIDDFVIIDLKKLKENGVDRLFFRALNRIDMKFCRIDPLQHHGHWICLKEELNYYDNSFLPLFILKDAKSLIGNSSIYAFIDIDRTKTGLKRNLINTCKSIENLAELYFKNEINSYQLKGLIGSFVLMPSFIMQINSKSTTKPEAIKLAHTIFSTEALNCIIWSTNCRKNWGIITSNYRFKAFSVLPIIFTNSYLWRRFSKSFSPGVTVSQNNRLSDVRLNPNEVEIFIKESLSYAKN